METKLIFNNHNGLQLILHTIDLLKKWQMYNLHEAQRQLIIDEYIDSEEVIAWCEIPTFTDKETK